MKVIFLLLLPVLLLLFIVHLRRRYYTIAAQSGGISILLQMLKKVPFLLNPTHNTSLKFHCRNFQSVGRDHHRRSKTTQRGRGLHVFNLPQVLCSRSDCWVLLSLWTAFPSVFSTRNTYVLWTPYNILHLQIIFMLKTLL